VWRILTRAGFPVVRSNSAPGGRGSHVEHPTLGPLKTASTGTSSVLLNSALRSHSAASTELAAFPESAGAWGHTTPATFIGSRARGQANVLRARPERLPRDAGHVLHGGTHRLGADVPEHRFGGLPDGPYLDFPRMGATPDHTASPSRQWSHVLRLGSDTADAQTQAAGGAKDQRVLDKIAPKEGDPQTLGESRFRCTLKFTDLLLQRRGGRRPPDPIIKDEEAAPAACGGGVVHGRQATGHFGPQSGASELRLLPPTTLTGRFDDAEFIAWALVTSDDSRSCGSRARAGSTPGASACSPPFRVAVTGGTYPMVMPVPFHGVRRPQPAVHYHR